MPKRLSFGCKLCLAAAPSAARPERQHGAAPDGALCGQFGLIKHVGSVHVRACFFLTRHPVPDVAVGHVSMCEVVQR